MRFTPHTLPLHSVLTSHNTHLHVGFYRGRKTGEPGEPGEKPSWHRREQHIKQTQLTYDPAQAGARTRDHRGERPVDKPLSHPCQLTTMCVVLQVSCVLCFISPFIVCSSNLGLRSAGCRFPLNFRETGSDVYSECKLLVTNNRLELDKGEKRTAHARNFAAFPNKITNKKQKEKTLPLVSCIK